MPGANLLTVQKLIEHLQEIERSGLPQKLLHEGLSKNLGVIEPWTALTDSILATWVAFWAAYLFCRANGRRPVVLWAWAFLASAVSSLAGVAFHGCRLFMPIEATRFVWKLVPVASGVATLCLGLAAAIVWLRPAARRAVAALLVVEFAACLGAVFLLPPPWCNKFLIVIIDSAPVLLALLIGSALHWKESASRWIVPGVLTAVIAGAVQFSGWRAGHPPDNNDIFHVIQMAAMYFLYRGGVLLGDPERD
ncbi:MAG: hypothetical protein QOC81_3250 [Thermoanaerobaculia bacterium]|jgi:hypothetical protein|nr:hypothetical protein [Thermoanaerobaculia bacterium]